MSPKTSTWMIAAGALLAFIGLCTMPGSFGQSGDKNLLGLGASIFALGALTIAGGTYLKAKILQLKSGPKSDDGASLSKPLKGGCDRCQMDAPAIHCKVHQQHLCGTCLAEHYDFRSCVYVPSSRRSAAVKTMAARAR